MRAPLQKRTYECTECGYAIVRMLPPDRCPMCQRLAPWAHVAWRPFSARGLR